MDQRPFARLAKDDSISFLKQIVGLLRPLAVITGGGNPRLSVDVNSMGGSIAQVTLVPTVTLVNNLNNLAGVSAFELLKAMNTTAYNTGVRANIT